MYHVHLFLEKWLVFFGIDADTASWLERIILIGIILLIALGVELICKRVISPIIIKITEKTKNKWDDYIFNEKLLNGFCQTVPSIITYALLPVAFSDKPFLLGILLKLTSIYILVMILKLVIIFASNVYEIKETRSQGRNTTLKGAYQMLKIIIIFVGVIGVVSILLDKSPINLFAGLGALATILMLVFKDTIVGLVSGVQLSANDMLKKGDWISIPKCNCDGIVTDVSLTTIKVQNWDNSISTIPPYTLVSESFVNWRGMKESAGRRVKRSIPIDMNSIGFCSQEHQTELISRGLLKKEDAKEGLVNLQAFRMYMENYIRSLKVTNPNLDLMTRELQPTIDGLPIEFYFFSKTKEWIPFEHIQADLLDYVFAILPLFNLKICQRHTQNTPV